MNGTTIALGIIAVGSYVVFKRLTAAAWLAKIAYAALLGGLGLAGIELLGSNCGP